VDDAGAYGLVCSAEDRLKRENVAIKKIPKVVDDVVDGKRVRLISAPSQMLVSHHREVQCLHVLCSPAAVESMSV